MEVSLNIREVSTYDNLKHSSEQLLSIPLNLRQLCYHIFQAFRNIKCIFLTVLSLNFEINSSKPMVGRYFSLKKIVTVTRTERVSVKFFNKAAFCREGRTAT